MLSIARVRALLLPSPVSGAVAGGAGPDRYNHPVRRSEPSGASRQSRGLTRNLSSVGVQGTSARVPDSLLNRVAAGDPDAVRQCIEVYGGLVWSLARRLSLRPADVEDAVQEVFMELWRSAGRFDERIASEPTFVAMIARRRLIDRRRKALREKARETSAEVEAVEPSRQPSIEVGEEARRAAEAMQTLSPEQQRVLRLSIYQGLSHERIAASTGLPLGTVKTHIRRGLIQIRKALGVVHEGASVEVKS